MKASAHLVSEGVAVRDHQDGKFPSLWPLPGGNGRHFQTLLEILDYIARDDRLTFKALCDWMRRTPHYHLHRDSRTIENYVRPIERLGYIHIGRDFVKLTDLGQILRTRRDKWIVIVDLLTHCLGVYDTLAMVQQLGTANEESLRSNLITQYAGWKASNAYTYRLTWLFSLGCIKAVRGGYEITADGQRALREWAEQDPRLHSAPPPLEGSRAGSRSQPTIPHVDENTVEDDEESVGDGRIVEGQQSQPDCSVVGSGPAGNPYVSAMNLAARLVAASRDSDDATGFERMLAEVFEYLGFVAEHRSGPGDTDVLVTAPIGRDSYRAIVDGKSSHRARVGKQQIDWYALDRHRARHDAAYILVVAPAFTGGDLLDNAARAGAALICATDLAEIVAHHSKAAFSLADLRDLFKHPGRPDEPLASLQRRAAETLRHFALLPEIIRALEDDYRLGISDPISAGIMTRGLARRLGRAMYTKDEIIAALELLSSPIVGVLRRDDNADYGLQMPMATVARRFEICSRQLLEHMQS